MNVSVAYVGHLESGKRHPSDKLIAKLADALDLDKRELFFLANPAAKVFSLKAPSLTVTLHGMSFRQACGSRYRHAAAGIPVVTFYIGKFFKFTRPWACCLVGKMI